MADERLAKHQRLLKEEFIKNKQCFIKGCEARTIRAHSLTNNRLMTKIADKGMLLSLDLKTNSGNFGELVPIGRAAASTFRGFCDVHDKAFGPIDNADYVVGDKKQEFLFAMRAHAKEFNTRTATDETLRQLEDNFDIPEENKAMAREFYEHFSAGTEDQKIFRTFFNDTFAKDKYNAIDTVALAVDGKELPVLVSSAFNLERDERGNFINDVSDLEAEMKPTFMTVFPQNGNTYCLVSYLHKDRRAYRFLSDFTSRAQEEREVLISNLIFSYVENFFIQPQFWEGLEDATKQKVKNIFAISLSLEFVPLVADPSLNLFENI